MGDINPPDSGKQFHMGLELLRVWMCFEVVFVHFYLSNCDHNASACGRVFQMTARLAVPVFMMIAFFFSDIRLLSSNATAFGRRMRRLFVPQLFWATAYTVLSSGPINGMGKWTAWAWQVVLGHTVNESMWFQADLIVLTALSVLVARTCSALSLPSKPIRSTMISMVGLAVAAWAMVCTGTNYALFASMPRHAAFPLGRICEMAPFAALGCLFRAIGPVNTETGARKRLRVGCVVAIGVLTGALLHVLCGNPPGFNYQEPFQFILAAVIFGVFLSIPLRNASVRLKAAILGISRYSLGIYCMHRIVGTGLLQLELLRHVQGRLPFLFCILVFTVCWGISVLFGKAPVQWIRGAVH